MIKIFFFSSLMLGSGFVCGFFYMKYILSNENAYEVTIPIEIQVDDSIGVIPKGTRIHEKIQLFNEPPTYCMYFNLTSMQPNVLQKIEKDRGVTYVMSGFVE